MQDHDTQEEMMESVRWVGDQLPDEVLWQGTEAEDEQVFWD